MRARLPLPGSAGPPLDQPGTAHNYSRSSRERVAERRWRLAGFQVVSNVRACLHYCMRLGGEERLKEALTWMAFKK